MMKISVVLFLVLAGCMAEVVQRPDNGPYAPKENQKPNQGTVVYNPAGIPDLVNARREDALKKIYGVCGGNNCKIVKEELVKPKALVSGGLATVGATTLNQITYECQ